MSPKALSIAVAAGLFIGFATPAAASNAKSETPDAPAEPVMPDALFGSIWQWTSFADGKEAFDIQRPENYTLTFVEDGSLAVQVDCNRGFGTYSFGEDGQARVEVTGVSMAMCIDSTLHDRFLALLGRVSSYFWQDGSFFLELPIDSGTLRFVAAEPE